MKWVTYRMQPQNDSVARVGVVIDEMIHALDRGESLQQLLGDDGTRLREAAAHARASPAAIHALSEVQLLAPIPQPRSIRDYSSFEDHYRAGLKAFGLAFDSSWYESPSFYFSNNNVVVGDGVDVRFPRASHEMDYELEVAAVVGREGVNLTVEQAESCIAGYTIFNDFSARDAQRIEMEGRLGPAKGIDHDGSG